MKLSYQLKIIDTAILTVAWSEKGLYDKEKMTDLNANIIAHKPSRLDVFFP